MGSKKFLIIVASISCIILTLIGVFALNKDFRSGLISTIQTTLSDTKNLGGDQENPQITPTPPVEEPDNLQATDQDNQHQAKPRSPDNLKVYIPDTVGDCIILVDSGEAMVINGGYSGDANLVKTYLSKLNIKKYKYIVATNYLDASIEGLPKIMSYKNADYILISSNVIKQQKSKALLNHLTKNRLIWTEPSKHAVYPLGKTKVKLLTTHYGGSLAVVVTNGSNKLVFTGTTTYYNKDLMSDLPTDVDLLSVTQPYKSYAFPKQILDKVNPKTVILNDHRGVDVTQTIKSISTHESTVYRSTQSKNIIIGSNGTDIKVDTKQ